jgi:hypothetical protein
VQNFATRFHAQKISVALNYFPTFSNSMSGVETNATAMQREIVKLYLF